jgi:hypothetical protein
VASQKIAVPMWLGGVPFGCVVLLWLYFFFV